VLEKDDTCENEPAICEKMNAVNPDVPNFTTLRENVLDDANSTQIKRWSIMLRKIRNYLFSKKVAFIVAYYFVTSIEHSSDISKFSMLQKMINNRYMNNAIHEHIITLFQRAQRCYYGFTKLARYFRIKRTKVQITTDLYMSELIPTHKNTFLLLDNNRIYYFSLKDVSRILTESLTYSYSFFSEPTLCKNPYNNIPFTKSTLYNIYFQMKSAFCIVPKFIQLFFEVDFNIYKFKKQNEWKIREYKINEYIDKTDPKLLKLDIMRMFSKYDIGKQIEINPDTPHKYLLQNVKPLYQLYLCKKYSNCPNQTEYYENELIYKMSEFIRINPLFGRKINSAQRTNLFVQTINTPFYFMQTDPIIQPETPAEFMRTHQYSDQIYNRYIQYGILNEPFIPDPDMYQLNAESESETIIISDSEEEHHPAIVVDEYTFSESDTENDD